MDNIGQHIRDLLTEREHEILKRLSSGMSDHEIAADLVSSAPIPSSGTTARFTANSV